MVKPWQVKESRTVVDRKWIRVHEQRIALPHGGEIDEFHLVEGPDWSSVLAITEAGEVVFVNQYRHGVRRASLELPAGVIDDGETPEQAARRELLEETGHAAEAFVHLISVNTEPSRHTTRAHFYVALDAHRVADQAVEPSEDIEVVVLRGRQILEAIERGTLHHGVHVGAILLAAQRGLLDLA